MSDIDDAMAELMKHVAPVASANAGGEQDDQDDQDEQADQYDADLDTEDQDGDEPDLDEKESDEDQDEGDDEETDDLELGSYSDDDILEVMVDGQKQEVTIRDLKNKFAGEGAIEKRLQEATEARKAAIAERENGEREIESHRTKLLQAMQQLDQFLFMPLVKAPEPTLRTTNFQEWMLQKDAYEEDQQRISALRSAASTVLTQNEQQRQARRNQIRDNEAKLLAERAPELKSAETAKEFQADLQVVIDHYGITPEQMAEVDSHIMWLIARDAGRYLKLTQKANGKDSKAASGNTQGQQRVKRLLKAGTVSSASKSGTTARAAKAQQAATAQARKTGSVDDVAGMLLAGVKTRTAGTRRN